MGNCIARPQAQSSEADKSRSAAAPQQRQQQHALENAAVRSRDGEACIIVPEAVASGGPRSANMDVPMGSAITPKQQREVVGSADSVSHDARERENERRAPFAAGAPRSSATPALVSAQPPSARPGSLLHVRAMLPEAIVVVSGGIGFEHGGDDAEPVATPPPSSPPLLLLRSPSGAERTGGSHASTASLFDETSHTRPESLVTHEGGSSTNAADVSYATDVTALEESFHFTSIPLVEVDGDTVV